MEDFGKLCSSSVSHINLFVSSCEKFRDLSVPK